MFNFKLYNARRLPSLIHNAFVDYSNIKFTHNQGVIKYYPAYAEEIIRYRKRNNAKKEASKK